MKIAQNWRPRDAWFFTGSTILFSVLFAGALIAPILVFPSLSGFLRGAAVKGVLSILGLIIIFCVSLFFSKVRSSADFTAAFGLTRPREQDILLAVTVGLLIQFVGIYIFGGGFSHLHITHTFQTMSAAVLLAPFFEEPAMRGFAYKAFRNSYPPVVSIGTVVAISLVFHLGLVHNSLYGFTGITALNVALCMLREKHLSLWSCIACHFAFNAAYVSIAHHSI